MATASIGMSERLLRNCVDTCAESFFFRCLLSRNHIKDPTRRRSTITPIMAPAIIPPGLLFPLVEGSAVAEAEEAAEEACAEAERVFEALATADEGPEVMVDAGELALMHELSSDAPTLSKSDDPPLLPWASVMVRITCVPDLTFAFQE